MHWLQSYNKRSKFCKNLKPYKINTKLKNSHFWVLQLKFKMILSKSKTS